MAGVPFNSIANAQAPAAPYQPQQMAQDGLAKLKAAKAQAPNGAGLSDAQFALAIHQNHYADMPLVDFLAKTGLDRGDVLYELRAPGDPYGAYARQALATPGAGEPADAAAARHGGRIAERRSGPAEGVARALVQGGTMGWGDEGMAAVEAALDPLVHGDRGKDYGERYDAYLNRERGAVENFREDNPVLAYGAEIAGAIPTAIAAGGNLAAQAPNLAGRVLTRAGVGGAQGAIYGLGSSEGDSLGERAPDALSGALLGAGAEVGAGSLQDVLNGIFRSGATRAATREAIDAAPKPTDLKATANADYDAAFNSGLKIKPQATAQLRQNLVGLLDTQGLVVGGKVEGNYGLVKRAMKQLDRLGTVPITFQQLQRLEEHSRTRR